MAELKKFDIQGKATGAVALADVIAKAEANPQLIKDYIVAIRANQRQWSACTKGRSEVNHSNKKPHRQKGTGNARQGSLAAPQYKGGGVVFGPKPKFDQHVRINKKERRAAIATLLNQRASAGDLIVIEDKVVSFDKPSTKQVAELLKSLKLDPRGVLFVTKNKELHFQLSVRNLERSGYQLSANLNGYDLMAARKLVITESALQQIVEQLEK